LAKNLLRIWTAVIALFIVPVVSQAADILVLRSAPLELYDEAIATLNHTITNLPAGPGIKTIFPHTISQLDITGPEASGDLDQEITSLHPDLVVALGSKALAAVSGLDVPVIALMTPNLEKQQGPVGRIYQIHLMAAPAKQLAAIHSVLPKISRIGIIYDPKHSVALLDSFREAAGQQQLTVVARELSETKSLPKALSELQGEVEALLLIPDPTVITPITLDILSLFSLEKQIPVIGFAAKYLNHGAVMAVYLTPAAMGEAAGNLARQLLTSRTSGTVEDAQPTVEVEINQDVANKLGLVLQHPKNSEMKQ